MSQRNKPVNKKQRRLLREEHNRVNRAERALVNQATAAYIVINWIMRAMGHAPQ